MRRVSWYKRIGAVALLGAAVSAVLVGHDDRSGDAAAATDAVIVTRDDDAAPPGCGPRDVAVRLRAFYRAFNRGDTRAAAAFFAPEPEFEWFTFTLGGKKARVRRHFEARDHKRLRRYLAARHRQDERLRLVEVRTTYDPDRGLAGFAIRTEVRADDLRARRVRNRNAVGKGAMSCASGLFTVTSMSLAAVARPVETAALCPAPPERPQRSQSVACAPPRAN
jgi:hypothetical protein